jgi:cytochrome P450
VPFSQGPRACLGRKFTETESVAALCAFVLRFRVALPDGASAARVLASRPGVTMTCVVSGFAGWRGWADWWCCRRPVRMPLVFRRR